MAEDVLLGLGRKVKKAERFGCGLGGGSGSLVARLG